MKKTKIKKINPWIIAILIVAATGSLLLGFSSTKTDRITAIAVEKNDASLCESIPPSPHGDGGLFDRYYCIASVLRTDSFCQEIDTPPTPGWGFEESFHRDNCYFAAALVLDDKTICEKIKSLDQYRGSGYCKELIDMYPA